MNQQREIGAKEWIEKHWYQTSKKFPAMVVGEQPHHKNFRDSGWTWTPKLCLCSVPCIIKTDAATLKKKT